MSTKLRFPSRPIVFNEDGILEKQRLSFIARKLRNKIMKPFIKRMLVCIRKLADGYIIFLSFFYRSEIALSKRRSFYVVSFRAL